MAIDKSLINVILLSLAFMLVFTAFQTMGNIQQTIIDSVRKEDSSFSGDGYISLAIIYTVMSILNWAAPSVISVIGPRLAILIGGCTYIFFILTFLLPLTWLLYLASVIIGCGAAVIWTGEGNYLTLNSSAATISRNSGIFWAILQLSMFIGNIIVFFAFKGKTTIEKATRNIVVGILSGIGIGGLIIMGLLPKAQKPEDAVDEPEEIKQGPLDTFKAAVRLFFTKNMLLLCVTFFYTGLELGFFSGVYSNSIGFTKNFEHSKELVGLSGILIGVGEVLGGAAFGILGAKTNIWGRNPIVIAGFIVHIVAFVLIALNLPGPSPLGDTTAHAIIESSRILAIACSFLLGLGDACYNTQLYSMLGGEYSDNSAAAFAIFKFTQAVAAAICFGYSIKLDLYFQLGILVVLAVLGTFTFVWVEWHMRKEKAADTNTTGTANK